MASPSAASWIWAVPPLDKAEIATGRVDFDTDNALVFTGLGGVYAMKPPSSAWTTVEEPSDSLVGSGNGAWAVWVEKQSARVRGWNSNTGELVTLVQSSPDKTCLVAVTETRVIGVALDADCAGAANGPRLWSAPRTGSTAGALTALPALGGALLSESPYQIRANADWVAVRFDDQPADGGTPPRSLLLVANLPTGAVWRIRPSMGYGLLPTTFGMDAQYLYWGENDGSWSDFDQRLLRRIVRVPLANLDSIGDRLQ